MSFACFSAVLPELPGIAHVSLVCENGTEFYEFSANWGAGADPGRYPARSLLRF